jgi:hypothetical protein
MNGAYHDEPVALKLEACITEDSDDAKTGQIDWSAVDTVATDRVQFDHSFDADSFYRLSDIPVARPIKQPYVDGDSVRVLYKPRTELQRAAWTLDGAPLTLEHPPKGVVADRSEVRGLWTDPQYDTDTNALRASLLVPKDDAEIQEFIEEHGDVSIGFFSTEVSVDEYEVDRAPPTDGVDGYQTDLYIDHVAAVTRGRCPADKGCGFNSDESMHTVGDWVQWGSRGGTAYGKVDDVVSDGCTTRGKGDQEVCAEDGDPAVVVEVYNDDTGESSGDLVRHKMSTLSSWNGPSTDAGVSDIDLVPPESAQNAAQRVLDARGDSEKDVSGMTDTGWSRAEQLSAGNALSPSDIVAGSDAMAPWWSRHAEHTVETSDGDLSLSRDEDTDWWKDNSYVAGLGWGGVTGYRWAIRKGNAIKNARGEDETYSVDAAPSAQADAGHSVHEPSFSGTTTASWNKPAMKDFDTDDLSEIDSHFIVSKAGFPPENFGDLALPVVEPSGELNLNALRNAKARAGQVSGLSGNALDRTESIINGLANDNFDANFTNDATMTVDIELDDMTIDKIASEHDGVRELTERVDALESTAETLDEVREAIGCDEDTCVVDAAEALQTQAERVDELSDELESYRADERDAAIDRVEQFTDRYQGEYDDMSLDELEAKADELEELSSDVSGVETDAVSGADEDDETDIDRVQRQWMRGD